MPKFNNNKVSACWFFRFFGHRTTNTCIKLLFSRLQRKVMLPLHVLIKCVLPYRLVITLFAVKKKLFIIFILFLQKSFHTLISITIFIYASRSSSFVAYLPVICPVFQAFFNISGHKTTFVTRKYIEIFSKIMHTTSVIFRISFIIK